MPYVAEMVQKYGYKSIFLATDSSQTIAHAISEHPEYRWLYQQGSYPWKRVNRRNASLAEQFDAFLLDTYLLSFSDGFVGSFVHEMDRIAYSLMTARASSDGSCLKPFASVSGT